MRDKMFEFAHRLEESYANRIQEMLTPLVGPGRVRAQVVAQVDMATTESDARAVQSAEPGRAQRIHVRRGRQERRRRTRAVCPVR